MSLEGQNAATAAMVAFRKHTLGERMKSGVEVSSTEIAALSRLEMQMDAREALVRLNKMTRRKPDPEPA